jgi:hypothetical protein
VSQLDEAAAPFNTMSPVDMVRPNLTRHPRFAAVIDASWECRLGPGDLLYVPAHWWHEVESRPASAGDLAIGVNYFFEPFYQRYDANSPVADLNRFYDAVRAQGEPLPPKFRPPPRPSARSEL